MLHRKTKNADKISPYVKAHSAPTAASLWRRQSRRSTHKKTTSKPPTATTRAVLYSKANQLWELSPEEALSPTGMTAIPAVAHKAFKTYGVCDVSRLSWRATVSIGSRSRKLPKAEKACLRGKAKGARGMRNGRREGLSSRGVRSDRAGARDEQRRGVGVCRARLE